MDITPLLPATRQLIQRYGSGSFTIAGRVWEQSVIVFPDRTLAWTPPPLHQLDLSALQPILDAPESVEILLLGCGGAQHFLSPDLRASLRERGIGTDSMDTGAACRTFNILLAEERRVAAALMAI